MKHIVYALVIVALLWGTAMGAEYNLSSGNKTSDALIYTGRAIVKQVFIQSDGTSCSVALYGNTSAAGTVIFPALLCIGANGGCTTEMNVMAPYGIYADMTLVGGSACTYNVHYQEY
jgi:hypothetical protein